MHACITLRFAGTRYHGFQVQKNALSVCEVLQNALESLYGVRPPGDASGSRHSPTSSVCCSSCCGVFMARLLPKQMHLHFYQS